MANPCGRGPQRLRTVFRAVADALAELRRRPTPPHAAESRVEHRRRRGVFGASIVPRRTESRDAVLAARGGVGRRRSSASAS
ncbi:MAG TPA: hypothetical protein VM364_05130, partial [Vicinamibacterales bacterium]|nr:hypothetical protein [Vicinamibacterales bacterium]